MTQPPTPPTPPWEPDMTGVSADATAEQLAALATTRPDLWSEISAHPNSYDGLRSWIAESSRAAANGGLDADATMTAASFEEATRTVAAADFEQTAVASNFERTTVAGNLTPPAAVGPDPASFPGMGDSAPPFAPPSRNWMPPGGTLPDVAQMPPPPQAAMPAYPAPAAFGPPPVGPAPTPFGAAPDPGSRPKSKSKKWIAGGVAAALAISGGGVALALTDTWPFGESGLGGGSAASRVAQGDAAPTFAQGIEEKWSVSGSDLGSEARLLGYLPRMLGQINVAERSDQPVLLDPGVLLSFRPDSQPGDVPASWALLDPKTGEPKWIEEGLGYGNACASNAESTEATCVTSFVAGSELVGFDADGLTMQEPSQAGSVQLFKKGWQVVGDTSSVRYDRAGKEVGSVAGVGDSGARFGNSGSTDCVWISGGETVSYVGAGCAGPEDEILGDFETFNWAVVGDERPVILIDSDSRTTAFDAGTREQLWSKTGTLPGWYQAPQLVKRDSGDGVLVWNEGQQSVAIVDVETGDEVKISTTASDRNIAVAAGQVLAFSGNSERTLSSVEVFDGETGDELYAGSFPEVTDVAEVVGGPNGVLFSHYFCDDCSTAEGSHSLDSYTFMGPANNSDGTAQTAGSVSIPDTITIGCPADTILLAWAEFADGWVLVCGVSTTEPTFMAYQGPDSSKVLYSVGAQNPTSADAKAAVDWDAGLSRYIAELDGGDRVTLDYDIGTAVRRDSVERKTIEQQRFVRYVFVPLGESVRTVTDTAQEDGAFDVQAPDDTADDQVRYMIEVLEKAYAGRALVKDALPKLEYCTASAGGYSDTVSAMEAVRDNRAELLSSLDAMPVDRVPEGSALLDDLYAAIEASHRANIEYVAWAEAANASGCASLSSKGARAAASSDAPKERFASRWNRAVAPKFGVRTFDAWYI